MTVTARQRRTAMLVSCAFWTLAGAGSAFAQAAPAAAAAEAKDEAEIVVVGSQIQGAKVNTALPVTVVDQTQIKATAAVSGDELFRTIPEAGNVNFNSSFLPGTSNSARGDVNSISLRNIGSGNTLVLINGRRTVVHPTTQAESLVPVFTYNTNAIPVGGIQRVEVLRDGAAAIYGSDAVAGVINTVMDDHFKGLRTEAQYGYAEGTHLKEGNLSATFGTNFADGKGNITVYASAFRRSSMLASDEPYTASNNKQSLFAGTPFATSTSLDGRAATSAFGQFQTPTANGVIRSNGVAVTGTTGIFHIAPQTNAGCSLVVATGLCIDANSIALSAGDRNLRPDSSAYAITVIPKTSRYNLFTTAHYEISPAVTLYGEIGAYNAQTHGNVTSQSYTANTSTTLTVPATAYYNPFGAAVLPNGQVNPNRLPGLNISAAGVPVTISSYNFVDVGATPVIVTNNQFRFLAGLKGKLFGGWHFDTAALYTWATVNDKSYWLSSTKTAQAIALSTPDAYNPFNGGSLTNPSIGDSTPSNANTIAGMLVPVYRKDRTSLGLADFKVSRPDLIQLPGGSVGVALGVEARHETYTDNRDSRIDGTTGFTDPVTGTSYLTDIVNVANSPDVHGKRTVESAFAEFQIPVISPDMHIPLVNRVDLQIAGRAENYSDVGSVAKPKIAGNWDLFPGVRLRGSWEQGFRAPNLEQLNITSVSRSNSRQDYIYCEADLRARRITSYNSCARTQSVQARRAGNPDLQPETSTSWSYGIVLESKFLPSQYGHLTATVDIWHINQKNIIGVFGEGNAVIVDYYDRLMGTTNPLVHRADPTPDQIAAFAGTGLAPAGTVLFVDDKYVNQQPQQAAGVDFGLIYSLNTVNLGHFQINANASHQTKLYQSPTAGIQTLLDARAAGKINAGVTLTGFGDLIGQNGNVAWRGSGTFAWNRGPLAATWFVNYTGKFYDTGLTNADGSFFNVPSTFIHNASVSYEFQHGGLKGTRFLVGARNIFNKNPPLVPGGFEASVYNPYARYVYFNIRRDF